MRNTFLELCDQSRNGSLSRKTRKNEYKCIIGLDPKPDETKPIEDQWSKFSNPIIY